MPNLPDRVMRRVTQTPNCWLWTGSVQANGYGYTRWKINGKWGHARVHRIFFEAFVGPIPTGMEIDHTCKTRACVNPAHLRAVTHAENLKTRNHRGPSKGIACKAGHPWTEATEYIQANGHRACRICRTEAMRRHRAKAA